MKTLNELTPEQQIRYSWILSYITNPKSIVPITLDEIEKI